MDDEQTPNILSRKGDWAQVCAIANNYSLMFSNKLYHKFTILNGALFNQEQVLSAIMKHVLPHYLLAVKYVNDGCGNSCFLSSNCWAAIKALINSKLMVTIPELDVQIELTIHLDYSAGKELITSPIDAIQKAFKKRISVGDVMVSVDVSNFESDKVFTELGLVNMYFPLWVPQFQRIIVQTAQSVLHLKHLNFSHNKISSLYEISRLTCPKLEELDLSYNEITWSDLIPILPKKVKHLWLQGNPLCETPLAEYITAVKAVYPLLEKLDGVTVYPEGENIFIMRNSFANLSCTKLVDQFLHHYFNWFTKPDGKGHLIHMYHKNASISVSCNISSTADDNMPIFQFLSRNILRISDYGKIVDSFQTGTSYVSFVLSSLPPLQLDPMTTTVDVPYYEENKVIQISLSGLFQDKVNKIFWLGFTFLLQASLEPNLPQEWKIINHMISFTPSTKNQLKNAFGKNLIKLEEKNLEPSRDELLQQFKELTSMKTSWCGKFLESTNWVFESALQSFVDQYKGDMVPEDAFLPL